MLSNAFFELHSFYQDLCHEVEYILQKRISSEGIAISAITSRAKSLESFLEKIDRKSYSDPFHDITDFSGVRIVCLYRDDISMLESIINEEFIINEKVDKMAEKEPDQFGYGAIHYIVTLGERFSGTRYDELKKFLCEIQVRTVLQDAWANIEHHLVYKQESAVPKDLQRKLNGLSGLFETADNQFQQIRDEQNDYIRKVRDSQRKIDKFLAHDIDLDTLREFLLWKFSNIPVESFDDQLGIMIKYFKKVNYNILRDIDQKIPEDVITKAIKATAEMDLTLVDGKVPSCVILLIALVMVDSSLYESIPLTTNMQEVLAKYA